MLHTNNELWFASVVDIFFLSNINAIIKNHFIIKVISLFPFVPLFTEIKGMVSCALGPGNYSWCIAMGKDKGFNIVSHSSMPVYEGKERH